MIFSQDIISNFHYSGINQVETAGFRHILVPVDFSECSYNAIRYAIAIGLRTGASIKLFHAVQLPLNTSEMLVNPLEEMEHRAAEDLKTLSDEIVYFLEKEKLPELHVTYTVRKGFTGEEVISMAKSEGSDLIVMGTKGVGAVEGFFLGSNAANVIANADAPVLTVPGDAVFHGIRKVVFMTDMKEHNAEAFIQLGNFAAMFDADLHVVHLATPTDKYKDSDAEAFGNMILNKIRYSKTHFSNIKVQSNDLVEDLEEFYKNNPVDIIAMLTHHRSFFQKIIHPSITNKIAKHARIPLLAFHA